MRKYARSQDHDAQTKHYTSFRFSLPFFSSLPRGLVQGCTVFSALFLPLHVALFSKNNFIFMESEIGAERVI